MGKLGDSVSTPTRTKKPRPEGLSAAFSRVDYFSTPKQMKKEVHCAESVQ